MMSFSANDKAPKVAVPLKRRRIVGGGVLLLQAHTHTHTQVHTHTHRVRATPSGVVDEGVRRDKFITQRRQVPITGPLIKAN